MKKKNDYTKEELAEIIKKQQFLITTLLPGISYIKYDDFERLNSICLNAEAVIKAFFITTTRIK